MRVLVVEPTASIAQAIMGALERREIMGEWVRSGEDAIAYAESYRYDIMVLEMDLPDMEGIAVIRGLRALGETLPVLPIAPGKSIADKVAALGAGADDYMDWPLDMRELVARVLAIVRRARGYAENRIEIGNLTMHLDHRTVSVGDAQIYLSPREYAVLECLALRRGAIVTHESILSHVYGPLDGDYPMTNIVKVWVNKLRRKIGRDFIKTIWNQGLMLDEGA